ncbi:helix-turn-helix transcriptional regulator [uncultured Gemmiger sp.]|uniref:helix-turn-helix domain-containing protein n=1 Tax=uncultured Gemmiger sp. TaxID=1623490 RepID=UPI0025F1B857|nr:helix-turn-helix transcriptional regulator [uncultured Gemmiger sp.]
MPNSMDVLKEKIAAANLTQDLLAAKIGMNPSTLYRKIKSGGAGFTVGEVHRIVDELHLTDIEAQDIFLS